MRIACIFKEIQKFLLKNRNNFYSLFLYKIQDFPPNEMPFPGNLTDYNRNHIQQSKYKNNKYLIKYENFY